MIEVQKYSQEAKAGVEAGGGTVNVVELSTALKNYKATLSQSKSSN